MSGRRVFGASTRRELIEQLVLALLEFGDLVGNVGAVPPHRVEMSLGVAGLVARGGRFGDHRPDRLIVGVVAEMTELLVDYLELGPQRLEP